jgi:hypothetical protein
VSTKGIVFYKPDALEGIHSRVSGARAGLFCRAIALHLGATEVGLTADALATASAALAQITERSTTEAEFVAQVREPVTCRESLLSSALAFEATATVATVSVLDRGLGDLGFDEQARVWHTCSERDVDAIYCAAACGDSGSSIVEQLRSFLGGHVIQIVVLGGFQDPKLLQHWKTIARHALLDRRTPDNRLRNLVHVCESADRQFVAALAGSTV